MRLSLRLKSLLDRCEHGLPVWDLCCDHGILGRSALNSGRFPEVIFNDAVKHVTDGLSSQLVDDENARVLCSFAEDIAEPLTGNVVIAGIGGEKIFKILRAHAERGSLQAKHLIVCPEKDAEWLAEQPIPGYSLIESLKIPHIRGQRMIFTYRQVCSK